MTIVLSAPWWLGPSSDSLWPEVRGDRRPLSAGRVFSFRRTGRRISSRTRVVVKGAASRSRHAGGLVVAAMDEHSWSREGRRMVGGSEWQQKPERVECSARMGAVAGSAGKDRGRLASWVPHVEAGKGVVRWPQGELTLASAIWRDRTISSPDLGYKSCTRQSAPRSRRRVRIEAGSTTLDGSTEVNVRSQGASARGRGTWWDQPAELTAEFNEQGWLPREGRIKADGWEFAGDRVKLGKQYTLVRGSGTAEWRDRQVNTVVSVEGVPVANSNIPPLSIQLRGHSNNDAFVAETLQVSVPGFEAQLSAPVAIDRNGRLHSAPSDFTVSADLAKQPWFPASGRLQGSGKIRGCRGRTCDAGFLGRRRTMSQPWTSPFRSSLAKDSWIGPR